MSCHEHEEANVNIVDEKIEDYLEDLYGKRHEVLNEMEAEAQKSDFPIVGTLVGKLLYQLARMIDAKRVFEMGSGFGYSAFAALRHPAYHINNNERDWWALAMNNAGSASRGGEILLTEKSETNREKGEAYLKRAGLLKFARYQVGNALDVIDKIAGEFDVIFIDIEKQQYPAALDKAVKRIRRGGLLVADNVLWSGKVSQEKGDASTESIKEFNRRVFSMNELAASIVPVRDGVMVAYKI
jgi:caffeoyl-CoA O-methyltransferase